MKNIKYLLVLFILSLLFVSCEKQPQKEWTKLYGYTAEEIAGTYAFSNISDAFESLTENAYCHVCEDAKIDITAGSANTIEFHVNCPSDEFNRTFEGRPRATDDDYLINLTYPAISSHPSYELTAYVYKNDKDDRRLSGFVAENYWKVITYPDSDDKDTIFDYSIKYHFDVVRDR